MQAPGRDPWRWTLNRHGHDRGHRQRRSLQKGRGFAAWLGVVPGQHSTGGKQQLTGISRRGNKYLRKLFVLGAHTVLLQRTKQSSGLSMWLASLVARKRKQVATVALANKDGTHGLGGAIQRRGLSAAASTTNKRSLNGLHMTP